ncbi:MAG: HAD family hydrolase, partial [Stenotrophobium sp.]
SKAAFGPNLNLSPEDAGLFRNLQLMEMLTNSCLGSVTSYGRAGDGTVYGRRLTDESENNVYSDTTAHIQAGILHGVRFWAEYVHVHALSSGELRETGRAIWLRIVKRTPSIVVHALARLKHNELFGRGAFEQPKTARSSLMQRLSGFVK